MKSYGWRRGGSDISDFMFKGAQTKYLGGSKKVQDYQGRSKWTAQPQAAHGLAWILKWVQFCIFFTRMWKIVLQFFCKFNAFLFNPLVHWGQFKTPMDNSRRVGMGDYFSKVGWPVSIMSLLWTGPNFKLYMAMVKLLGLARKLNFILSTEFH